MTEASATPRLLFTTSLSGKHLKKLDEISLKFRQVPFITFEYPDPATWLKGVTSQADAWVFTSKRAVKALKPVIDKLNAPDHIFTVGPKTAKKTEKHLGLTAEFPSEYNVESLSSLVSVYEGLNSVIHFCGNLRSDVLKKALDHEGIKFHEIEVYQTVHAPKQVETRIFDGFVFMSPSAVDSFLENNELDAQANVFCIGSSTGKALDAHNITNYHLPEESTFKSLIETIENYFA